MIHAVTFDVGGTLIEPWPSVGDVYAEEAAHYGWPRINPATLNRNFQAAWRERNGSFTHSAGEWAALVDKTFAGLVDPLPSQSFFPALYDRFARGEAWRIFDDVLPALRALRAAERRLVVISNWDTRLRPLLLELGLSQFFEDILISLEIGSTKPDPAIFLEAARRLQLDPSQILHVGDDPQADTEGARQAGFEARTVARGKTDPGNHAIRSLSAVLPLVAC